MSYIFRLFLVLILLGFSASYACAQGSRTIAVNFFRDVPASDVKSARVFVYGEGVQLHTSDAALEKVAPQQTLILASTRIPGGTRVLSHAFVLTHADGRKTFLPFTQWDQESIRLHSGDAVALEQDIGDAQGAIEKLIVSIRKDEKTLSEYREKIDQAIGMGRLATLEDEKRDVQTEIRELKITAQQLAETVQQLGKQKRPSNFSVRQGELTEQLRLLADKTRAVESGETGRAQSSKALIADKQAKIAEVRDLKVQDLQAEVIRLKQVQEDLQKQLKMSDQELAEYMQY